MDQFNGSDFETVSPLQGFFAVSTNLTAKKFFIVDGLTSRSYIAPVAIATTGWTNTWNISASVVYGGTTVSSWKKRADSLTATNITYVVFTGANSVNLRPGEALVVSGTGVSGTAEPSY